MWMLRYASLPYWRRHPLRALLALVTIAAGVASVAATLLVADSVLATFNGAVDATAGDTDLQVTNGGLGVDAALVDEIAATEGVAGAYPVIEGFVRRADGGEGFTVFGIDVAWDPRWRPHRDEIRIPDEEAFVMRLDSIALASPMAKANDLDIGDSIAVYSVSGRVDLTIRGLIDTEEPLRVYDGRVAVMDLPGAQALLGREGRADRIDVLVKPDSDVPAVEARVRAVVAGRGDLIAGSAMKARAGDILLPLRVILALASAAAFVVGFFIVLHSLRVAVNERAGEIGLLSVLGVSPTSLAAWLGVETGLLAAVASMMGSAAGVALAYFAIGSFDTVTAAWLRLPPPNLVLSSTPIVLAVTMGFATTWLAAGVAAFPLLKNPRLSGLRRGSSASTAQSRPWRGALLAFTCFVAAGMIAASVPTTLPYRPLVSAILCINVLVMLGVGAFSPLPALVVGTVVGRAARSAAGPARVLAASRIVRDPVASTAAATAIVMAFGWTLANASVITSFKGSWFRWFDEYYKADIVVTAGGAATDILTAQPFTEKALTEIRAMPETAEVQGLRRVELPMPGRPTILVAFDETSHALPSLTRDWQAIAEDFWSGSGVLVSDSLAHRANIEIGDTLTLATPDGERRMPVLDFLRDVYGGDLGSVAIARRSYRAWYDDSSVDRVQVWLKPVADAERARAQIDEQLGLRLGVRAMRYETARGELLALIDQAFAISYALIVVCIAVSIVGVVGFLIAAVAYRAREYQLSSRIGLEPKQIVLSVVGEALMIAATGVIAGLIAGAATSRIIVGHSVPMVTGWRFEYLFPFATALALTLGTFAMAGVASLLPGGIAARAAGAARFEQE